MIGTLSGVDPVLSGPHETKRDLKIRGHVHFWGSVCRTTLV